MRKRTKARRLALQYLYQCDVRGSDAEALDSFIAGQKELVGMRGSGNSQVFQRVSNLVARVTEHLDELDSAIASAADNWRLDRMSIVDRNVLRISTAELLYDDSVPPKVAVDEGIELARLFGSVESAAFVNGILDRIMREHLAEQEKEPASADDGDEQEQPSPVAGAENNPRRKA